MITEQNEMLQQGNLDLRIERNALHTKLREANNQIAQLEFELESLKSDAGKEIHDMSVRHSIRLTAANAMATEVSPAIEIINAGRLYIEIIGTGGERDKRVLKALQTISDGLTVALRQYREAAR